VVWTGRARSALRLMKSGSSASHGGSLGSRMIVARRARSWLGEKEFWPLANRGIEAIT